MKFPIDPRTIAEIGPAYPIAPLQTGSVPQLYSIEETVNGVYGLISTGGASLVIWAMQLSFNSLTASVNNICRLADDVSGKNLMDLAGIVGTATISSPDVNTPLFISGTTTEINLHVSCPAAFKASAIAYASLL